MAREESSSQLTARSAQLTTSPMPWYRSFARQGRNTPLEQETSKTYRYKPLDTSRQEIRVLHVQPKTREKRPRCRLEHVSLAATPKPKYETISYCWRNPTPRHVILVEGFELRVPYSAWLALKRLALDSEDRTLWIDAVCINQSDRTERGHQVSLMRDVYSLGRRNIVYLGETRDEQQMHEAFAIIKNLHAELTGDAVFQEQLVDLALRDISRTERPILTEWSEGPLFKFFSNSWFSRLWVLQETCLASKNFCVLGIFELDFRKILEVAYWLRVYHITHVSSELFSLPGLTDAADTLDSHMMYHKNKGLSLSNTLFFGRDLEASNLHDKVYGLLGLVSEDLRDVLEPNYGTRWQYVYSDATRAALRNSQGGILRMVSHRDEADIHVDDLPSWAARLQRRRDLLLDCNPFAHNGALSGANIRIRGDHRLLSLEGWMVDTVKLLSESASTPKYSQWFRHVANLASSVEEDTDQLARTLMSDCNWQKLRSTSDDRLGYQTLVEYIASGKTIPGLKELDGMIAPPTEVVRLARFWQSSTNAVKNRKFSVSENGLFLLVPKVTQPSDYIAYIEGCEFPLVLRQKEYDFRLIGECYIDGLMRWQEDFDELYEQLKQSPMTSFSIY
ncbi:Heterokaryon incompatibility protein 6, OR allele [Pseudocercospora fuligena]|uniref:Heterokaryon incompatibility protein 6, OR allele n=1 Tax=Pseudocercospora fuligena TaxID=685502 RepID=A0A8H6RPK4_9PEZI|nr:Heterokaryon incompatibility protein 6, OR allele [Pseudocercospora fuligena]